jgi:adenosylcobinamide amidohydrolase
VVEAASELHSLSSAVLGGGIGRVRTWLNLGVEPSYARLDPDAHLRERAAGLTEPVVGTLTAVDVATYTTAARGSAAALATVGAAHGLAAAGRRPRSVPGVGTINVFVAVGAPLTDAGMVGALATAVEAKAQALTDARVLAANADGFATGTATDAICVACFPGATEPFAGPATRAGADLAQAVHAAVLAGAVAERRRRGSQPLGDGSIRRDAVGVGGPRPRPR